MAGWQQWLIIFGLFILFGFCSVLKKDFDRRYCESQRRLGIEDDGRYLTDRGRKLCWNIVIGALGVVGLPLMLGGLLGDIRGFLKFITEAVDALVKK
jgi:hypothetical protein